MATRLNDDAPLEKMGLREITVRRLGDSMIHTLGDLAATSYHDLIAVPRLGATSIGDLDELLTKHGRTMKDRPASVNKSRVDKDRAAARVAAGKPSQRRTRTTSMGGDKPYVEVIVQQGYRCRACDGLTVVADNERPKGIQSEGFTWSDDVRGSVVPPFFVCSDCAGHVEIIGKLVAALMGESAL